MARKSIFSRNSRLNLFSARAGSSVPADASAGRISRLCQKAKHILKRISSKTAAPVARPQTPAVPLFTNKATKKDSAVPNRHSCSSDSTEATAVEESCQVFSAPSLGEPSDSASGHHTLSSSFASSASSASSIYCAPVFAANIPDKPVTETNSSFEPGKPEELVDFCAAITGTRKNMVTAERVRIAARRRSLYWSVQQYGELRTGVVDWLCLVAESNNIGFKSVHLSIEYLDRFLGDSDQPIEAGDLKLFAFACLFSAATSPTSKPDFHLDLTHEEEKLFTFDRVVSAMNQVARALSWCFETARDESGKKTINRLVHLPTMPEFLAIIFQRAAVELPEVCASRKHLQGIDAQNPRCAQYADEPFLRACQFAHDLLRNSDCLYHRTSELAAACFYLVVRHESTFNPTVFKRCTGRSLQSLRNICFWAHGVCEIEGF
ncbi:G1/S-specific cyclin-E1 [Coemansia sp. RSA 485]|nr:G1/S-specific cyclin-E1 [Coemansia sp. RSA 485]